MGRHLAMAGFTLLLILLCMLWIPGAFWVMRHLFTLAGVDAGSIDPAVTVTLLTTMAFMVLCCFVGAAFSSWLYGQGKK